MARKSKNNKANAKRLRVAKKSQRDRLKQLRAGKRASNRKKAEREKVRSSRKKVERIPGKVRR